MELTRVGLLLCNLRRGWVGWADGPGQVVQYWRRWSGRQQGQVASGWSGKQRTGKGEALLAREWMGRETEDRRRLVDTRRTLAAPRQLARPLQASPRPPSA